MWKKGHFTEAGISTCSQYKTAFVSVFLTDFLLLLTQWLLTNQTHPVPIHFTQYLDGAFLTVQTSGRSHLSNLLAPTMKNALEPQSKWKLQIAKWGELSLLPHWSRMIMAGPLEPLFKMSIHKWNVISLMCSCSKHSDFYSTSSSCNNTILCQYKCTISQNNS